MKHKGKLLRKCNGCNEMKHKSQLFRICRTIDKKVEIDLTFKLDGRGAYICKNSLVCLDKAIKSNRFSRTLKIEVPMQIIELLRKKIEDL